MKHIKKIFEDYLNRIGELKPVQLGDDDKRIVTEKDSAFLETQINGQRNFNNTIIIVAMVVLCVIFLVGVALVIKYIDHIEKINIVFGGTFLSLLSIVYWLRKLWLEKSVLDISMGIIQNMPPEKAADYISTLYWRMINKKK